MAKSEAERMGQKDFPFAGFTPEMPVTDRARPG